MRKQAIRRAVSAALLAALAGVGLSTCRSNLTDSDRDTTVTLRIAGPAASAKPTHLILGNASWLRVTLTADGNTETYQQAAGNTTFTLTVELGKTYAVNASAGKTDSSGTETTLYAAFATLIVGQTKTLTLYLLPVETTPWPEINADSYTIAPGALAGLSTVTYRVRLGSASRWYINTATGYGTGLELYVQNEDGSAVTPSAYAADHLVVEKSSLNSDAASFLLTMYNASTQAISAASTTMDSYRDSYAGALLFQTTLENLTSGLAPAGITYLANKLYVATNESYSLYSLNTDGTGLTEFINNEVYCWNSWGITNDGTSLFVATQGGYAARWETDESLIWYSAITNASGIAVLGSYAYVTYNGGNLVYRVPVTGSAAVAAVVFAGTGTMASADGARTEASFYSPSGICSDGTDLYVIETTPCKIRKIDLSTGYVSTFAGSGTAAVIDGVGTAASFSSLNHIASDGTYLYVTDGNTLRRVTIATAQVETMYAFDSGLTLDGLVKVGDAFYVADSDVSCVYKVY